MKEVLKKYHMLPKEVKASLWFLVCAFLQKGITTLTTPIFTRLMNVEEYGQFNVFTSIMSIASVFITLNLFSGVYVSGLVKFNENRKEFASCLQGLCLSLLIIWTAVYLLFDDFFNSLLGLSEFQVVSLLLLSWTNAVFQFWATEQRVLNKYKSLVAVTIVVSVIKPIVGVVLVYNCSQKVLARIIGILIVELSCYTWMFVKQMVSGKVFYDRKIWRYALGFNVPLIPHYLSSIVLNSSDRLMIKRYVGSGETGLYSLAYTVSLVMLTINQSLYQAFEPWLLKKIKKNETEDIGNVLYPVMILVATVNLLMIIIAPEVVKIFAPPEYYSSVAVIPSITMSVYFLFCPSCFSAFAFYYRETKLIALATSISAILNIALNFMLLPRLGYVAAGYTTLLSYIVYMIVHYWIMCYVCKKHLSKSSPYNVKKLLAISCPFIIAGYAIGMTYNSIIIRYSILFVAIMLLLLSRKKIINSIASIINCRSN